jgi:hypothetical protein
MHLSFLPGDLHLTQNEKGLFVVTMAGKEILSTKSEPYALHKFNSLRIELEHRFPAQELTAETKAELLRNEVADSIFRQQRKPVVNARIATTVLFEIETALRSYCETVLDSDLSEHSQADYIHGADNFVRWLKGDFDPGSRVRPYRSKLRSRTPPRDEVCEAGADK